MKKNRQEKKAISEPLDDLSRQSSESSRIYRVLKVGAVPETSSLWSYVLQYHDE